MIPQSGQHRPAALPVFPDDPDIHIAVRLTNHRPGPEPFGQGVGGQNRRRGDRRAENIPSRFGQIRVSLYPEPAKSAVPFEKAGPNHASASASALGALGARAWISSICTFV